MKITTWNINSVRLRMPLVEQFLNEAQPEELEPAEEPAEPAEVHKQSI